VNFLAHLFLSGDTPELLVGNLMGDFVKGKLDGRFPPGIERGILLHRGIDSFASQNRHFLRSKRRLDQSFGLYRGVLVDLFYDHFLAAHWEDYADVPLSLFISDAWRVLCEHKEFLPDRLQRIMPFMFREWLQQQCERLYQPEPDHQCQHEQAVVEHRTKAPGQRRITHYGPPQRLAACTRDRATAPRQPRQRQTAASSATCRRGPERRPCRARTRCR